MIDIVKGSKVYVPSSKVGLGTSYHSAMVECTFVEKEKRSGYVENIPGIQERKKIDLRLIHKQLFILIVQIGDFITEESLLDPLYDSIFQYSSLLIMLENIRKVKIRSLAEFVYFWKLFGVLTSHIVLIGHGESGKLIFGDDDKVSAREIIEGMQVKNSAGQSVLFISLCCKSGKADFGKIVSRAPLCQAFIGPSEVVHAANASQFYQTLMAYQLLYGRTIQTAYQYARVFTPGVTEFNMWMDGKLVEKINKKKVLGK